MAQLKITNGFNGMADLDFLGKVRFIVGQMTANGANFPTPDPSLAAVTTLANEFEQTIQDAEAGGTFDKSVRDSKKAELIATMYNLGDYVLFQSKQDRLKAESSGFSVARDPSPKPPIEKPVGLSLTDGVMPASYCCCSKVWPMQEAICTRFRSILRTKRNGYRSMVLFAKTCLQV